MTSVETKVSKLSHNTVGNEMPDGDARHGEEQLKREDVTRHSLIDHGHQHDQHDIGDNGLCCSARNDSHRVDLSLLKTKREDAYGNRKRNSNKTIYS